MTTNHMTQVMKTTTKSNSRALHVALWIAQGVLGTAFLAAGMMKITAPIAELEANMPWVAGEMGKLVRFIGAAEVLGGFGIVLPTALRIQPWLAPIAAVGFLVLMVLASATHALRGEFPMIGVNVVLGALAAFVAWGRSGKGRVLAGT